MYKVDITGEKVGKRGLLSIKKISSLAIFLAAVFLVEWIGHKLTFTSVNDWYMALQKPDWNPPNWVFGPVWTLLYITIAVSVWLVSIKAKSSSLKKNGYKICALQLFCNVLWSYFFFFLQSPGLALIDLVLLIVLIGINILVFARLYRPAAILLIPYFFWTLYATALNAAIWSLNR